MKIQDLTKLIEASTNLDNITQMEAYMKNQFKFLGIKSTDRRNLSKEYLRKNRNKIAWDEVFYLWDLEEREFQYIACDYLKERVKILEYEDLLYLRKLIQNKSWWDTVDNLAPLVGEGRKKKTEGKELMLAWSKDEDFWLRRASILHQIKFKEDTDVELLEEIIINNLGSEEFFINKAIGWILREYSKTNPDWVRNFMDMYRDKLNSLSRREGSKYI